MPTVTRLRGLRIAHEKTLGDVARECGISASYVATIEQGRVRPADRVANALGHYFRVPPATLLDSVYLTLTEVR